VTDANAGTHAESGQSLTRRRVLIADDVTHVRRLCAVLLETHGFEILEAENGHEAVELYRQYRPDMVLLDVHMPDGGLVALTAIKAIDPAARVGIVTGAHDALTVKSLLAAGAKDYLVKPFTRQRLLDAVMRLTA
jgi:two-component system chemotaxis response regulator CheY